MMGDCIETVVVEGVLQLFVEIIKITCFGELSSWIVLVESFSVCVVRIGGLRSRSAKKIWIVCVCDWVVKSCPRVVWFSANP